MSKLYDIKKIKELDTPDYILVTNSQDVKDILDSIGKQSYDYDLLIVKMGNGYYKEIWAGGSGNIAYLDKLVKRIY